MAITILDSADLECFDNALMRPSWLFGLVLLLALNISSSVYSNDESTQLFDKVEKVKASLATVHISQGPEVSKLTRSPWGPSLYRSTVDAVVYIILPGETQDTAITGSGVVVTREGHILTNWHVVGESEFALVVFRPKPPKTMADLTDADIWVARRIGAVRQKDVALLQLVTPSNKQKPVDLSFLKYVPLEDPLHVEVGQDVFAIGHPNDLFWSYTEGVISQIRPRHRWEADKNLYQATIVQTQTAIDHGSSGGPLINKEGKLVGLVSSMSLQAGFNFAIAVHELAPLLRP
jgi:S1-C subfamily serine protease